jgi:hypothetical protein
MSKEVLTPTEAKQGEGKGRMLRVLLTSLAILAVVGAVIYYWFLQTSPPI